jgi:phosphatidylinositol N-acetylglucosaminyltransferase subunit C
MEEYKVCLPYIPPSLFNELTLGCRFPTSLSLNLAILSSVVLASRLPSTTTVFSHLLFSVQWFALFPLFRWYLLQYSPVAFHTLTVILFLSGVACVAWIGQGNWLAEAVWGGVVGGGVGIGCPLGLIWLQKYKKYGSWGWPNVVKNYLNENLLP